MKRLGIAILLGTIAASLVLAQAVAAGEADPSKVGIDSAQQLLKEVSVTRFEDAAFYFPAMPVDQGIVTLRQFTGGPMDKEPIKDESALSIAVHDDYVLGAKVDFFKRGPHELVVSPVKPIQIEGLAKSISLWVVGRNYNHVLKVIISDYFGQKKELTVGKLNFMGWKKLTVAIPPGILQDEYHYSGRSGIQFHGIKLEFDMMETYGEYYVYFDDLRAWTDLFAEVSRDADSMSDDW
jgi:hypothetical protein